MGVLDWILGGWREQGVCEEFDDFLFWQVRLERVCEQAEFAALRGGERAGPAEDGHEVLGIVLGDVGEQGVQVVAAGGLAGGPGWRGGGLEQHFAELAGLRTGEQREQPG